MWAWEYMFGFGIQLANEGRGKKAFPRQSVLVQKTNSNCQSWWEQNLRSNALDIPCIPAMTKALLEPRVIRRLGTESPFGLNLWSTGARQETQNGKCAC